MVYPTAEVALNGLHQGQIIDPGILPLKYVAQTPVSGRNMPPQVEMSVVSNGFISLKKSKCFVTLNLKIPKAALEEMLNEAEELCKRLNLTHRVLELCAGDIGFQSAKTYDIEVWSPGSAEWLGV
ncbi:MAG: hypothetical protein CM1200mP39_01210 [Dehalococcoidia bacterium]|nr:MAG: hypothetical protein CM1200mP39_01210 [Dehalococcoidia bacterium]